MTDVNKKEMTRFIREFCAYVCNTDKADNIMSFYRRGFITHEECVDMLCEVYKQNVHKEETV